MQELISIEEHNKLYPGKVSSVYCKGLKLNLGSGDIKIEGFVNLDKSKEVNPDIIADIEKGIPFKDNTFGHIFTNQVLEHIDPSKFRFVLNEIQRVAKNGCILEMWLPFDNISSKMNYDHHRTFTWNSFYPAEVGCERNYYTDLRLKRLADNKPNKLLLLFAYMFPQAIKRVYLKYEVVK